MQLTPLPAGSGLSGVTGSIDGLRRCHFDLNESVTRFEPLYKRLLAEWSKGRFHTLRAPTRLLLALAFTSGLASLDRLVQLLFALDGAVRTPSGDWVHWSDEDWPHACVLSDFAVIEYGQLQRPVDWELELDLFEYWLHDETPLGLMVLPRGRRRALQALLRGALAYWQRLPGALFAHVAECQILTPASRGTLARQASRMALDTRSGEANTTTVATARSMLDEASFRASVAAELSIDQGASRRLWDIMIPTAQGGYATDRSARMVRIAEVFEATDPLDIEGNLRIAFALFMFTVGTPGAQQPSMVTCGRHFRSIDVAARALPGGLAELVRMTDEQKVETYVSWLQRSGIDPYLRAAIGAFHMFLVEQLGVAPAWVRGKSVTLRVPPLASIVWMHERELALEGIALSGLSARVQLMARTLLLLACDVPLRISDIRRLKWRNVRRVGGDLFVDIVEHRDAASAKSPDTLRTVRVNTEAAREALPAWMRQREDEAAEPQEWLFGDGFEPMEQAELAQAYAVVCALLKQVTGDSKVSFHTLRHTCITDLIVDALLKASDSQEWDPLEPVAARAGHASAHTSLTAYFHLLPFVLRAHIDRLLAAQLTTRLVARTCGLAENTLTQRRKRHPSEDEVGAVLRATARAVTIMDVASAVPLHPVELLPLSPRAPRASDLLEIITDLDTHQDLQATATRSGLSLDFVRDVSRLRNRARMIFPGRIRRKSWKHSKKVGRVLRYVDRTADTPGTREALGAWLHTMEKGYVGAAGMRALDPLLRLLQAVGVSHSMLILRVTKAGNAETQAIESLFVAVFGHAPVVELVPVRGDRAASYLQLSSAPMHFEETAASASVAMKGLHAVFTALYVWHALAGTTLPGVAD